jgi:hypothetical protein
LELHFLEVLEVLEVQEILVKLEQEVLLEMVEVVERQEAVLLLELVELEGILEDNQERPPSLLPASAELVVLEGSQAVVPVVPVVVERPFLVSVPPAAAVVVAHLKQVMQEILELQMQDNLGH